MPAERSLKLAPVSRVRKSRVRYIQMVDHAADRFQSFGRKEARLDTGSLGSGNGSEKDRNLSMRYVRQQTYSCTGRLTKSVRSFLLHHDRFFRLGRFAQPATCCRSSRGQAVNLKCG